MTFRFKFDLKVKQNKHIKFNYLLKKKKYFKSIFDKKKKKKNSKHPVVKKI